MPAESGLETRIMECLRNEAGTEWLTADQLAAELGERECDVHAALDDLEQRGLVEPRPDFTHEGV